MIAVFVTKGVLADVEKRANAEGWCEDEVDTLATLGSASLAVRLRDRGSHERRDSTQTSVSRIAGKQ